MSNESKALMSKVTNLYGANAADRLRTRVNLLGLPPSAREGSASDTAGELGRFLNGNAAAAYIGLNVISGLAQFPNSIAPFFAHADRGILMDSLFQVFKPGDELVHKVWEKSPMVKGRILNFVKDYSDYLQKQDSKWKRVQGAVIEKMMFIQRYADKTMVAAGWNALYETALKQGKSEDEAVVWADEITAETQPDMNALEVSPMYREKGLAKTFLMFTQPFNVVFQNLTYDSFISREKSLGRVVAMFTAYGLAALLVAAVRGDLYDGDDDEEAGELAMKALYFMLFANLTESLPLVGSQVSAALQSVMYGGGTAYRSGNYALVDELLKVPTNVRKGKWGKAVWAAVSAAGLATGMVPVSQLGRIKRAIEDEDMWALLGHIED
jgi:hypothetical protein